MATTLPLAIPWLRRPGEVAARDFLALEAATQQLEAQRSESLDGIRCQQAAAEARRAWSVTLLDRRLHRQDSDIRTTVERNQSIRQHINLYREEARAQVLPADALMRGGQNDAFDRLSDSKQSFVLQAERLKNEWHCAMEEQMREEIKAARSDAAHCQARQDEILSAAVRQETLLQDLCQERLRAQDERAKLYTLDAEVQERHRACREHLLVQMRKSGFQAQPEGQPRGTAREPPGAVAPHARSPQAHAAGTACTAAAATGPAPPSHPLLLDLAAAVPRQTVGNASGAPGTSSLHPLLRDQQPRGSYVPVQGTRQFEVYRRLTACELEMQSDLRLLEASAAAPALPSSLRLGGRPATAPSVPPAAFHPQVGPPLIVAQLPPIPPPPKQPDVDWRLESRAGLERKMQQLDSSAADGAPAWQAEAHLRQPPAATPALSPEEVGLRAGSHTASEDVVGMVHQPGASAISPDMPVVPQVPQVGRYEEELSAELADAAGGEDAAEAAAPCVLWSEHGEVEEATPRPVAGTYAHMEELRSSSLSAVDESSTQSRMEDLLAWARAQPRQPAPPGAAAAVAAAGDFEEECEEEEGGTSVGGSELGSSAGLPAGSALAAAPADNAEEVAATTAGQIGLSARSSQARAATREAMLARKAFRRPKAPGSRAASERAALEQLSAAVLEAEGSDSSASWNVHSTSSRGASPRAVAERASGEFGDLGCSFSFAGTPKAVGQGLQLLEEEDEEEAAVRPTGSLERPWLLHQEAAPARPVAARVEQPILPKASTIPAFTSGPSTTAVPGAAMADALAAGRAVPPARTMAVPAAMPRDQPVSSGRRPSVHHGPAEVPAPPEMPLHVTAASSSVANLAAELGSFVSFGQTASDEGPDVARAAAEQSPPPPAFSQPRDSSVRPTTAAPGFFNAEPTPELPLGNDLRRSEEPPPPMPLGGLAAAAASAAAAAERPLQGKPEPEAPAPWAAAASSAAAIAAAAAERLTPFRGDSGGSYEPVPAAAPKAGDPTPMAAETDGPARPGLSPFSTRRPSKTTAADLGFSDSEGEEPPPVPALTRRVSGAFSQSGPPSARPEPPASASSHAALAAELGLSSGSEDLNGGAANQSGLSAKSAQGNVLAELGLDSDGEADEVAPSSHYGGLRPTPKRGNPLARRANSGLSSLLAEQQEGVLLPGAGRPKARGGAPLSSLASSLRTTAGKAKAAGRPGFGGGASVLGGQIDWSQAEVQY